MIKKKKRQKAEKNVGGNLRRRRRKEKEGGERRNKRREERNNTKIGKGEKGMGIQRKGSVPLAHGAIAHIPIVHSNLTVMPDSAHHDSTQVNGEGSR